ncbi:MAG: metallophosphoesterase family protein, partial [candidate division KSB1 bacterium]|nr:metallophosphoesterase family protein [candidate division KSB1 bacterium]
VGPHQITVMWETPVACRGRVWYREESEGRWRKAEEASTRRVHELTLRNLKPDTRYSYCAQNGKAISALRHFRSAPIHRRPFRLAVWGDSRSDPRMHETVARRISEHCPDLAIHVGDVVGHGANWDEWTQMYFLPARGLLASAPSYIAIGNHEYGGFGYGKPVPPFEVYVSHPGNEYYFSFDYAGCHFIILDSNRPAEGGVPLGRQQFAWLLEDLGSEASRKADWRFVFLHHPPYSEAWDWGGYYDGEPLLREKLMPVLADYRVSFVFSGHTHDYERGRMPRAEGTYLVITGGGGAELDNLRYRDWPEIDRQEFAYHFCLLDVDSTRIHFRAIRHDGSILDEFTVDRAP